LLATQPWQKGVGGSVRELITLGALYDIVKHEHGAVVAGFEDEDVLVLGLFVVEDLVHFEGHCLARPHVGDLAEPAI
jgi:hypothetical protein